MQEEMGIVVGMEWLLVDSRFIEHLSNIHDVHVMETDSMHISTNKMIQI